MHTYKNLILGLVGTLFVLVGSLQGSFARAAQVPALAQQSTAAANVQAIAMATVNIQNAKLISQQGNTFHISFDLTNRVGVQTGVLYAVMLVSNTGKTQSIADQHMYDTSLTLLEHSSTHQEVAYIAPAGLSGAFDLMLTSKNAAGFPFAIARVATTTLASTAGIEILSSTCYVQVVGEKDAVVYSLMQGVDIADKERLILKCKVLNHGNASVSVTPAFETRYRTVYGAVVSAQGGDIAPIVFKAGETKMISLTLPKATAPQAYDVLTRLKSESAISNTITAHYVLRGESATIQTMSLDKNYYSSGEIATLSFIWTPSADSFLGSRMERDAEAKAPQSAQGSSTVAHQANNLTMIVTMTDAHNAACAQSLIKPLNPSGMPKVSLPITANCEDPHVVLDLKNPSGTVIAHQDLMLKSPRTDLSMLKSPRTDLSMLALLVGLIGMGILFLMRKKIWPSQH